MGKKPKQKASKDIHTQNTPETLPPKKSETTAQDNDILKSILCLFTPKLHIGLPVFALAVVICFVLSFYVRYGQYQAWQEQASVFFYNGSPMMTTLDAYYWISQARNYLKGTLDVSQTSAPMLIWLIAKTSGFFGGDLYKAGTFLIMVFAGLFMLPLGFYFYRLGLPAAGILAGLLGTFSYIYMTRSCVGRVDTDTLQLFFPILGAFFVSLINKDRSDKVIYILSASAGLSMLLFEKWYSNIAYFSLFFVASVLYLVFQKIPLKKIAIASAIFLLASNPLTLDVKIMTAWRMFAVYFHLQSADKVGSIAYPNILETITETQKSQVPEVLMSIVSSQGLAVVGLIGFGVCAVFNWRRLLPLLPLFVGGLVAFKSSMRFGMFLAPFVGAGIGYLIDMLLGIIARKFVFEGRALYARDLVIVGVAIAFFFGISEKTAYSYVPSTSIPMPTYVAFHDIKKIMQGKSAIFTWWDYGYALSDVTGQDVFHNGGAHGGWSTYIVGKAYVSDEQTMYQIIKCLGSEKVKAKDDNLTPLCMKQATEASTPEQMLQISTNYTGKSAYDNIYALYTFDMVYKYGAISFFGNWNFKTAKSHYDGYGELRCMGFEQNNLKCENAIVDLSNGKINNNVQLRRIIFSNNGNVIRELNYSGGDLTLQILIRDNTAFAIFLLSEKLYNSSFNQMYLLGRYDKRLFEELYNNFPHARLFRLKW